MTHEKLNKDKKVDFLVVGVQKSGTTSLDQYFRQHPDIQMPHDKKEVHFFDKDEYFFQGEDYYHSLFLEFNKKVWGECTPIYAYWQGALEKIYQYNPDIKLILVLRNPIERAFSHWNMEFNHNREDLSFYDALLNEKNRLLNYPNKQHRVYSYVDRGKYISQIKNIWEIFGKNNLYILKFDDLIQSPEKSMNQIYEFLGVSKVTLNTSFCSYQGNYQYEMSSKEKSFLLSCFKDEIKSLEELLGWDCRTWLQN